MGSLEIDDERRDKLSNLKEEMGMTYDGVVHYLLQLEEEKRSADTKHDESVTAPDPRNWYREGAGGAQEYVLAILKSKINLPKEYETSAQSLVWKIYQEEGIEQEVSKRAEGTTPPTIDDLIELISTMLQNPAEYSISGSESEIEYINHIRVRILRALAAYRETISDDEASLESQEAPNLAVPANKTYRGDQHGDENIVIAGDDELDVRPDLNRGMDRVSWGSISAGSRALAVAILADAYDSDRYAKACGNDLYANYTRKLSSGEPWQIKADEIDQYI